MEAKENGAKIPQIIEKFKLSRGAVRSTLDSNNTRTEGASLPKSGKPKEYTIY
jgi:hypothetical protein